MWLAAYYVEHLPGFCPMSCVVVLALLVLAVVVAVVVQASRLGPSSDPPGGGTQVPTARRSGTTSRNLLQQSRPRRPPRRLATPDQCWVGAGETAEVAGYRITGGMVYVGKDLPSLRSSGSYEAEPALIQPHLSVDRAAPERSGERIPYWPSYQQLSSRERAGYLEWLAAGRRSPDAPIAFVFLFFYGLERRILVDGQASDSSREEIPSLLREIEELLTVYGSNGSFRGYASALLEAGGLLNRSTPLDELVPRFEHRGWDIPLTTKMALGAFAEDGNPIPAVNAGRKSDIRGG